MLNWFYYSDTNTPEEGLEEFLAKRRYKLNSMSRLDILINRLKNTEQAILIIKANTIYNVYELCQEVSIKIPHVYIILIVPDHMEDIRRAMHVGASNLYRISAEKEEKQQIILQAEELMLFRGNREDGPSIYLPNKSRVLSVCSTKGGIGRTAITVNLATAFAKLGKKVAIIDANLQFGDVAMYLDIKPKLTIYEWVKEGYDQHNYAIEKYLNKHSSGVSILAAPPRPEFFEIITEVHLKKAIEELKVLFDIILIDTPAYLSEIHLASLEQSDDLLFLTTCDLPVLRRSKLFIDTLHSLELDDKVKIILNRDMKNKRIDLIKMEQILEKSILTSIPNHDSIVTTSVNEGVPFVLSHHRSPVAKGIFSLVQKLSIPNKEPVLVGR